MADGGVKIDAETFAARLKVLYSSWKVRELPLLDACSCPAYQAVFVATCCQTLFMFRLS